MSRVKAPEVKNKICRGKKGKLASAIKLGVSVKTQPEATTASPRSCTPRTTNRSLQRHLPQQGQSIIRRVPHRQVGIQVPGSSSSNGSSSGSHSSGSNNHGPLLHGTEKANGNAANGKAYEHSNVQGATLCLQMQGAIPYHFARCKKAAFAIRRLAVSKR